ncbi:MAG: hypothetical protein F9K44_03655 [Hyphomicrobiaceae bacterium]|nr:MAG: hypothetical protein F9K44_03655 [Hyphomicrobiaceae bacterium]
MNTKVVAVLPNAGLANKLFVWARAQVFARLNDLPVETCGWTYPKIGPVLRGELSRRMYGKYFRPGRVSTLPLLCLARCIGQIIAEPPCERLREVDGSATYLFRAMPHWSDLFVGIRDHRDMLRDLLRSTIRAEYVRLADEAAAPIIALHIRRGDFRPLAGNEDFKRVGGVRTPDEYFLEVVEGLRSAGGRDLPISIFSDGSDAELGHLLELPNVTRPKRLNDVSDLLLLSRARVIVTSAGSTFGEWAAFLSDGIVLRHPDHIHAPIRPGAVRSIAYEGAPPGSTGEWKEAWQQWTPVVCGRPEKLPIS